MPTNHRLKMMLASRITVASTAVDSLREGEVFTPLGYVETGVGVAENLAVIRELERMWESLFDTIPSAHEVYDWAVLANQSSEV